MIKAILNMLLFLIAGAAVAQVPDTARVRTDTTGSVPTISLPVLSDTTQYSDTNIVQTPAGKDTIVKKKVHSPRKATMRSLIIPGWGQIYNKKYWKVPIVYAAIGTPAYLFFYNKKWYDRTKYALSIVSNDRYTGPAAEDSLSRVHPQLKFLVNERAQGSLIDYRNEFRRSMDYSILFTLLMWGLNVVDATVDGHLKGFDVSDELSLKVRPSMINNSMYPGLSVVVNFR